MVFQVPPKWMLTVPSTEFCRCASEKERVRGPAPVRPVPAIIVQIIHIDISCCT